MQAREPRGYLELVRCKLVWDGSQVRRRLALVRKQMLELELEGLIVFGPVDDQLALTQLTGFEGELGSQALAVILPDRAAIFCYPDRFSSVADVQFDPRHERMAQGVDRELYELGLSQSPLQWLQEHLEEASFIGCVWTPSSAGSRDVQLFSSLQMVCLEAVYLTVNGGLNPPCSWGTDCL